MKFLCLIAAVSGLFAAEAAWYWPFGSDDEPRPPRLSELMEKASELIDEASDLAADGKVDDAAAKYREALVELDRVEAENPERAATEEFASLRNKRAYVSAAVDSMLLAEARDNARAVTITDTTELERKFAERRAERAAARAAQGRKAAAGERTESASADRDLPKTEKQVDAFVKTERERAERTRQAAAQAKSDKETSARIRKMLEEDPSNRRARLALAGECARTADYAGAKAEVEKLLAANPSDSAALNLLAAVATLEGDLRTAEKTLDRAIQSNPRDYNGFYNMASLKLRDGKTDVARRYYETGRAVGGPKDAALEEALR